MGVGAVFGARSEVGSARTKGIGRNDRGNVAGRQRP
jgi:hypothetical protein